MAAYVAGTVSRHEFAGEYQIAHVDVTVDAATGNVTLSEFDVVTVLSVILIEDPVAGCSSATALVDGTTTNKINIKLWKDNYSAADANYKDVRLTVMGLLNS